MTSQGFAFRKLLSSDSGSVDRLSLHFCTHEADVKSFIKAAFEKDYEFPAPVTTIPKATLVVGAGKLERQKFDDELPKWVTQSLRDLGFEDDRGGSAVLSSQATYKFQHDTGKNEKFVQVFPKIKVLEEVREEAEEESGDEPPQGVDKAKWIMLVASTKTFEEIMTQKIQSWMGRKRAMQFFKEKELELIGIEEKLNARKDLTPGEQKLYDEVDRQALEEKIHVTRGEMLKMVDEDKLTKIERAAALEQIRTRIIELEVQPVVNAKAIEHAKTRAIAVEQKMGEKGFRLVLKNEDRMKQLWKRSIPLQGLVEKAGPKGRWNTGLSQPEIKALGEKEEWDEEIARLAQESRFWFEEDDELAARVTGAKATVVVPKSSHGFASSAGKPAASSSQSAWTTVKPKAGASNKPSSGSAAKKKTGNAFSGLGNDSDSD